MPKTTLVVEHLQLFGQWTRKLDFDTCAICKESLNNTAPIHCVTHEHIDHFSEEASGHSLWKGACQHIFHAKCLVEWFKVRNVCPLCNAAWENEAILP